MDTAAPARLENLAEWYRSDPLADGVTHIFEPYIKPFYRCNIWHVRGRDRSILFDSGLGAVSLIGGSLGSLTRSRLRVTVISTISAIITSSLNEPATGSRRTSWSHLLLPIPWQPAMPN
jgi:hypothetical protein